ncbi:MAG: type II glyceraldehyde-3-phosphate dehydrogenase [Candidatus Nanohaloarchaea archaeon]|nr:type II glyceraldehyde-3-phosphate dehydrogenase [Candidatus Nanohaloarchaea archaeon]
MTMSASIAVNGIGTIGKRVARAIQHQPDMELAGIADVAATGELRTVAQDGPLQDAPLYGATEEGMETLRNAGFDVAGSLEGVLDDVHLVVDATPKGVDEQNKQELYQPNDVKAIFQGGAANDIAPVKFNANANYDAARGEDAVKVVSCNTTSLARLMDALDSSIGVDRATASLVRRGGDPKQDGRGPINSVIPVHDVPSHHAPDVQEVMPGLDITTIAVKVPTTLAHVHMVNVDLASDVDRDTVIDLFHDTPRVELFSDDDGYGSAARVIERMRDLERPRYDTHAAGIWEETVAVEEGTLYWVNMVHQESIVTPDNIDAARAMLDLADQDESIERTDRSLA